MKRRFFAMTMLLLLAMTMFAQAAPMRAASATPRLSFSGTTANIEWFGILSAIFFLYFGAESLARKENAKTIKQLPIKGKKRKRELAIIQGCIWLASATIYPLQLMIGRDGKFERFPQFRGHDWLFGVLALYLLSLCVRMLYVNRLNKG